MKKALLIICCFLNSIVFAQCTIDFDFTGDVFGKYHFTLSGDSINKAGAQVSLSINGTNIQLDSSFNAEVQFTRNDVYQVCYLFADSADTCFFDNCVILNLNNVEYVPLLDSINIWHYSSLEIPVMLMPQDNAARAGLCNSNYANPTYTLKQYTTTDTTINGNIYKIIEVNNESFYYSQPPTYYCEPGFIREDTTQRRVFFLPSSDTAEILLYDFSMRMGDSISLSFQAGMNYIYENGFYRLDSVKSMKVNNQYRRAFYLNRKNSRTMIWVEGIGHPNELLYMMQEYRTGGILSWQCTDSLTDLLNSRYQYARFITCFEHSVNVYKDFCAFKEAETNYCVGMRGCSVGTVCSSIDDLKKNSLAVQLSPLPADKNVTMSFELTENQVLRYEIQSINSDVVIKESEQLFVGKHSIVIDVSNLPNGFYLLNVHSKEGINSKKLVVNR